MRQQWLLTSPILHAEKYILEKSVRKHSRLSLCTTTIIREYLTQNKKYTGSIDADEWHICAMLYDTCVRGEEWLNFEPFHAGRLSVESLSLEDESNQEKLIFVYTNFLDLLNTQHIDFDKEPLVQSTPGITNDIIYLSIKKHIKYYDRVFGPLEMERIIKSKN